MRYAAYDHFSIYGVGDTGYESIQAAMEGCGAEEDPSLEVSPIEEGFAKDIEDNGFDPNSQSFDMVDGVIVQLVDGEIVEPPQ